MLNELRQFASRMQGMFRIGRQRSVRRQRGRISWNGDLHASSARVAVAALLFVLGGGLRAAAAQSSELPVFTNQRFTDSFGVMLDTFHDKRNGYIFTLTPSGGFTDALVTEERVFNPDWKTVWGNSAARTEDGWIAEMAIPFSRCATRRAAARGGSASAA